MNTTIDENIDKIRMDMIYLNNLTELEQSIKNALSYNNNLRRYYTELPTNIKQKIMFVENNLLSVLKDIEQLTY